DAGVYGDLVLPLKVGPHLSKFGVAATGRNDVVHDVDVDVVQHHHISVRSGARYVVDWGNQTTRLVKGTAINQWAIVPMLPKMTTFSVEVTLIDALTL